VKIISIFIFLMSFSALAEQISTDIRPSIEVNQPSFSDTASIPTGFGDCYHNYDCTGQPWITDVSSDFCENSGGSHSFYNRGLGCYNF